MAYLAPQDQEQDPNKKQAADDPNAATVLSSPSAAAPTTSAQVNNTSDAAKPDASPKGTSSGSFTNLQKYITANQGNDAAMGGAVENNAQTKATEADTKGSSWQQAAADKIKSNTIQDNGVLGQLDTVKKGGAAANIDQNQFAKEYQATYQGPKAEARGNDVEGFGDTLGAYDTVSNYGKLANGDSADKGALLQDVYGKGGQQYNGGERRLDSFILGSGKGGTQALQNIGSKYGNYTDTAFGKIRDLIGSQAGEAAKTTDATRAAVQAAARDAISGVEGRFGTAAQKAADTSAAEGAKYSAITKGDAAALKAAGLDDATIAYLQSHGAKNYGDFAKAGTDFHAGDFADDSDIGNYKNLLGLLGGVNSDISGKYGDDQLAKGGAGTTINSDLINAAKQAAGLGSSLEQAAAAKNSANTNTVNQISGRLANLTGGQSLTQMTPQQIDQLAGQLGVSSQDLADARDLGMDTKQFLNGGANNFGIGDVANADQLSQFTNLAKMLGISADTGTHQGAGYGFDAGAFKAALDAIKAAQPKPQAAPGPQQVVAPMLSAEHANRRPGTKKKA